MIRIVSCVVYDFICVIIMNVKYKYKVKRKLLRNIKKNMFLILVK